MNYSHLNESDITSIKILAINVYKTSEIIKSKDDLFENLNSDLNFIVFDSLFHYLDKINIQVNKIPNWVKLKFPKIKWKFIYYDGICSGYEIFDLLNDEMFSPVLNIDEVWKLYLWSIGEISELELSLDSKTSLKSKIKFISDINSTSVWSVKKR